MSYSSGAEIAKIRIKDKRSLNSLHEQVSTLKKHVKYQEIAIAEMGKEIKALRRLVTLARLDEESITGALK